MSPPELDEVEIQQLTDWMTVMHYQSFLARSRAPHPPPTPGG